MVKIDKGLKNVLEELIKETKSGVNNLNWHSELLLALEDKSIKYSPTFISRLANVTEVFVEALVVVEGIKFPVWVGYYHYLNDSTRVNSELFLAKPIYNHFGDFEWHRNEVENVEELMKTSLCMVSTQY